MTDRIDSSPKSRLPALVIVAIAITLLIVVIWRLDQSPSTDDAYVYADTIDVVPEVS